MPPSKKKSIAIYQVEDSLVGSVTEALCALKSCPFEELDPLNHEVDVDGLMNVVERSAKPVQVTFESNGWEITVESGGKMTFVEL